MCGIVGILEINKPAEVGTLRRRALTMAKKIRHRGPDWSGVFCDDRAVLAHERLSIVDVEHGAQPLYDLARGSVLAVNGEIYNHRELRTGLREPHDFQTASDCEVILYLYDEEGPEFLNKLNGIFSFVLYDPRQQTYLIARDHLGIVPLYIGWDREGLFYVASEMKALAGTCNRIQEFPPGHYYLGHEKKFVRWYNPEWMQEGHYPSDPLDLPRLHDAFEAAVRRQLMCDVPYGLLVSGGVDSSIVAAVAAKYREGRIEEDSRTPAWWPQMHTFSVGLKESPDLKMARVVADHIGAIHHEIHFTEQEGIDALSDVVYHLETFDITTIRAATPMYLMTRKIHAMGIKMILSGEGADEIFGGYLYFHKAPNPREFHEETVRKLLKLHQYDCLRANKSTAAWGVEARVPFLDREFLEVAMGLNAAEKMVHKPERMEKWALRKAFDGYLPHEILWRQKEQFSDGVGYSWINSLKAHAEHEVSDEMLRQAGDRFPIKTPETKEAYFYRTLFEHHFPDPTCAACVPHERSVACSSPTALKWDKAWELMTDPSGRAVTDVHQEGYSSP